MYPNSYSVLKENTHTTYDEMAAIIRELIMVVMGGCLASMCIVPVCVGECVYVNKSFSFKFNERKIKSS